MTEVGAAAESEDLNFGGSVHIRYKIFGAEFWMRGARSNWLPEKTKNDAFGATESYLWSV